MRKLEKVRRREKVKRRESKRGEKVREVRK